jgi:hypothetical protein
MAFALSAWSLASSEDVLICSPVAAVARAERPAGEVAFWPWSGCSSRFDRMLSSTYHADSLTSSATPGGCSSEVPTSQVFGHGVYISELTDDNP